MRERPASDSRGVKLDEPENLSVCAATRKKFDADYVKASFSFSHLVVFFL